MEESTGERNWKHENYYTGWMCMLEFEDDVFLEM